MNQGEKQLEFTLLVIMEGESIREYSLSSFGKSCINIGRDQEKNDICLKSGLVSHRHGRIIFDEGKVFYEDLESNNGTYYNALGNKIYLKN